MTVSRSCCDGVPVMSCWCPGHLVMVSRLCDDGVQGRDGRCVESSSCFQIFPFVPVCFLLLGSPAGLIDIIQEPLNNCISFFLYVSLLFYFAFCSRQLFSLIMHLALTSSFVSLLYLKNLTIY